MWGVAYRIPAAKVAEVRECLDIREVNGYSVQWTPFYPVDTRHPPLNCLVYIGLPSNPQFLGPQDPQALAERISQSKGPSGTNRDYLFELETSLQDLAPDSTDRHVVDLAERLRRLEGSTSQSNPEDRRAPVSDGDSAP